MHAKASLSVVPIVDSISVAPYLAIVKKTLASHCPTRNVVFAFNNPRYAVLEGEWDEIMHVAALVRDAVHAAGVQRIQISISLDCEQ
ncbi:hypothetical protein BJ741DRAFT_601779 [Chytriomyces cf. hyalinus JEL632]|nr:hypothetical protein BJ741DRAFT_601779 [Chytriomyces cf. hyalinus JEL632]